VANLRKKTDITTEGFHHEMDKLVGLLSQVTFFKNRNVKKADLFEICKVILLENFNNNEKVFDYGEVGDKFYIILKGQVRVEIPIMMTVPPEIQQERVDNYKALLEKIKWATNCANQLTERSIKLQKLLDKWHGYDKPENKGQIPEESNSSDGEEESEDEQEVKERDPRNPRAGSIFFL